MEFYFGGGGGGREKEKRGGMGKREGEKKLESFSTTIMLCDIEIPVLIDVSFHTLVVNISGITGERARN